MWTKPISIADYLSAPVSNPVLMPRFESGIYAAGLRQWSGKPKPGNEILWVGSTAKGKDPELLYRVSLLVLESIGFTGRALKPSGRQRRQWDTTTTQAAQRSGGIVLTRSSFCLHLSDGLRGDRTIHSSNATRCGKFSSHGVRYNQGAAHSTTKAA
jgi:hypothetical protein